MNCAKVEEGGEFWNGVGMKARKREHTLVEHNVPRDIDTARCHVKTLVAFMRLAIPHENTHFRSEFKFPRVIQTEMWPTRTSKNLEPIIIRS
jgi:hypothetical protein